MKKMLFTLLAVSVFIACLLACSNGGGEPCSCTPPKDSNNDCICDMCGMGMPSSSDQQLPCGPQNPGG